MYQWNYSSLHSCQQHVIAPVSPCTSPGFLSYPLKNSILPIGLELVFRCGCSWTFLMISDSKHLILHLVPFVYIHSVKSLQVFYLKKNYKISLYNLGWPSTQYPLASVLRSICEPPHQLQSLIWRMTDGVGVKMLCEELQEPHGHTQIHLHPVKYLCFHWTGKNHKGSKEQNSKLFWYVGEDYLM